MLDEIEKPHIKMKKVIHRGKRSKTLSEVKSVKNIRKNLSREEFSRDKSCAKGSPSFRETARPCI